MGTSGNMPPQAYTREMLAQAFDWLKGQPQYVRERATTADGLVSMFLQSRKVASSSNAEVPSVESFKSDLRNLAENLRTFETNTEAPVIRAPISQPSTTHHHSPASTLVKPSMDLPLSSAVTSTPPQVAPAVTTATGLGATITSGVSTPKPIEPRHSYDSQTMEAIQTVRQKLNLSSDSEALRMLVKLGFEKVRSILN